MAGILLVSGCSASLNNKRPFRQYIGEELTLQRPAYVYFQREIMDYNPITGPRLVERGKLYLLSEKSPEERAYSYVTLDREGARVEQRVDYAKDVAYLAEVGTPLKVSRVTLRIFGSGPSIYARGEIYDEKEKAYLPFEYMWPMKDNEVILHAAWENETVAEERFVGFSGDEYGRSDTSLVIR